MTFETVDIHALVFDVFGTVVDWRGSIIREGEQWNRERGWSLDWAAFADAWRAGYQPAMEPIRSGARGWATIDQLHREVLDRLLAEHDITDLSEAETERLNAIWHRLDPWPDAVAGLARLKQRYTIATLSNGNVALLVNMAKRAGLPWDAVLSAELARQYKPRAEVYQTAAALLGLVPSQVIMVAAHRGDLEAARRVGMATGFVHRPLEFGTQGRADVAEEGEYDVVAEDFVELVEKLEGENGDGRGLL